MNPRFGLSATFAEGETILGMRQHTQVLEVDPMDLNLRCPPPSQRRCAVVAGSQRERQALGGSRQENAAPWRFPLLTLQPQVCHLRWHLRR